MAEPHIPDKPQVNVDSSMWTWKEWFSSIWRMFRREIEVHTSTTSATNLGQEFFWPVDCTGGAVTVTLPAANLWRGKKYLIKKTDASANAVTIARASSDTIDGTTSYTLSAQYEWTLLVSDGVSAWSTTSSRNGLYVLRAGDTMTGDLQFTGTGRRIKADFNNATISNRCSFQSNITDGNTSIQAIPNGASTTSGFVAFGVSDSDNSNYGGILATSSATVITSDKSGTGTAKDIQFQINAVNHVRLFTTGSTRLGKGTVLATNATDGFPYIPSCAGTPTGTPTAVTGGVPMVIDTTNSKLYVYIGGAWKSTTLV